MDTKRRKFQGVLNILSFNRHFYIGGLSALAIVLACGYWLQWPSYINYIIIAAFAYGLLAPLIVSAYVYDLSNYYAFQWLHPIATAYKKPAQIVNINAGFDETSFIIERLFPEANISVFDFYNALQHTEPAIKRARKVTIEYRNTRPMVSGNIPLESQSTDLVFLLSAAHEIRSHHEKIQFFKECHRICKTDGKVIVVEHLRDLPNFLAFTIGFTHFFSKNIWKNTFKKAGFKHFDEQKFTPFMSVFYCSP